MMSSFQRPWKAHVSSWMSNLPFLPSLSDPDQAPTAKTACIKISHNPDQLSPEGHPSEIAAPSLSLHPTATCPFSCTAVPTVKAECAASSVRSSTITSSVKGIKETHVIHQSATRVGV